MCFHVSVLQSQPDAGEVKVAAPAAGFQTRAQVVAAAPAAAAPREAEAMPTRLTVSHAGVTLRQARGTSEEGFCTDEDAARHVARKSYALHGDSVGTRCCVGP